MSLAKWNIECLKDEQVFENQGYGVKFVIPPSSVEEGQEVKTKVNIVVPEKSEIILPPDVDLVSCFYKIETTGKFSKPIELHLQHNVKTRSQEKNQQLAFITAKGPPPYKFELLPIDIDQNFKPGDNSGIVKLSDFCIVSAIKKIRSCLCQEMPFSYVINVFIMHIEESSWGIQIVITKNLEPFLQVVGLNNYAK